MTVKKTNKKNIKKTKKQSGGANIPRSGRPRSLSVSGRPRSLSVSGRHRSSSVSGRRPLSPSVSRRYRSSSVNSRRHSPPNPPPINRMSKPPRYLPPINKNKEEEIHERILRTNKARQGTYERGTQAIPKNANLTNVASLIGEHIRRQKEYYATYQPNIKKTNNELLKELYSNTSSGRSSSIFGEHSKLIQQLINRKAYTNNVVVPEDKIRRPASNQAIRNELRRAEVPENQINEKIAFYKSMGVQEKNLQAYINPRPDQENTSRNIYYISEKNRSLPQFSREQRPDLYIGVPDDFQPLNRANQPSASPVLDLGSKGLFKKKKSSEV